MLLAAAGRPAAKSAANQGEVGLAGPADGEAQKGRATNNGCQHHAVKQRPRPKRDGARRPGDCRQHSRRRMDSGGFRDRNIFHRNLHWRKLPAPLIEGIAGRERGGGHTNPPVYLPWENRTKWRTEHLHSAPADQRFRGEEDSGRGTGLRWRPHASASAWPRTLAKSCCSWVNKPA
jgi:hypothetical protein